MPRLQPEHIRRMAIEQRFMAHKDSDPTGQPLNDSEHSAALAAVAGYMAQLEVESPTPENNWEVDDTEDFNRTILGQE